MINLLPSENISENLAEYRRHRLVVAGGILLALILATTLLLGCLLFILRAKLSAAKAALVNGEHQIAAAEFDRLNQLVRATEAKIKILNTQKSSGATLPALIERVVSDVSPEIKLLNLNGEESSQETLLHLSGRATTRQSLLAFISRLESDRSFATVESPISNLIKDRDVDFSIILHVRHEK